jgi:GntR family transcriptional regulator
VETLAGAWALILWAVLVMIVSVIRRRRCHRDDARPIRRGRQAALVAGALVIAAVAPAVGAWHGRFAFGLLLAGPVFCLMMAAGSLATELLVRPVAAPRRRATLAARHFLNYVDRPQLIAVCAVFAVAAAFLTTASFFGDPDDKGRPGRFLRLPNLDPDPTKGGWSTLWPGAYYSLPLLAALGITLLMTFIALRRIAARPRAVTADGAADPVAADDRARRRSATIVLAAAGVAPAALDDPTPPYAQLRRGLAALIEQGTLAGGQRLPTVRQLAGDLGIAAGTVMRAYKELESAGYVRGDRRRGTVVIPRERDSMDVNAALRALAVAYCRRAEEVGATPEQTLAAVSRVLGDRVSRT